MERNDLLARITIDPEVCNGRPTIRGKRITAQTVLEFLSAGESREEILRQYQRAVAKQLDAGPGPPMMLSEFLQAKMTRRPSVA